MTPHVCNEPWCLQLCPLATSGSDLSEEAREPGGSGAPRRAARRKQILLVEDDRSVRDALQGILEEEGYGVMTAENGRRALEALHTTARLDLIVLDLRMPVMDGWQFRAAQKNDLALAAIPVLAVSADGSAKAAAIDAEAYLRKPLSAAELLRTVGHILGDTERRQMQRQLEEIERFAAQGRLAVSIGHEINNPLTFVSVNIDQAAAVAARILDPNAAGGASEDLSLLAELLAESKVGLDRIRDVTRQLQVLSLPSEARLEAFSLNDLIDESLAMARSRLENRAQVRRRYAEIGPVCGRRSALGQVLLNLIVNAAQALPEGRAQSNELRLETYERDGRVVVEVADTGRGIPSHLLPHIFDPFYTTKPVGEGTGLGLAICYQIVGEHGGRIDVASKVGRGSVFRVSLPSASAVPRAFPDADRIHSAPAPAHARILVIDDEPLFGRTLSRALQEHDMTVVECAEDAFAKLAADANFDAILCDLQMPDIGGPGVLDRITRDWPHLATRVIFMTGGAFTRESREFVENATQTILTKPFPLEELRAAIGALMAGARPLVH
jgi:signal transduction histidine kinase